MPLYLGSQKLFSLPLGGTEVPSLNLGATKVFPEPPPVVATNPASQTVTEGAQVTFTAAFTVPAENVSHYEWWQWNGSTWTNLGVNSTTLTHTAVLNDPAGTQFMCRCHDKYASNPYTDTALATLTVNPAVSLDYVGGTLLTGSPAVIDVTLTTPNPNRKVYVMTFQRGWSAVNQACSCNTTGEVGVQILQATTQINGSSTSGSVQVFAFDATAVDGVTTAAQFSITGGAEWGRVVGVFSGTVPGAYQPFPSSALIAQDASPATAAARAGPLANAHSFVLAMGTNTGGSQTNTLTAAADPNSGAVFVSDLSGSERSIGHAYAPPYTTWVSGWNITNTSSGGHCAIGVATLNFI